MKSNPEPLKRWLVAYVKGDAAIDIGNRIYPDQAPDQTPNPCLIYQLLDADFGINLSSELDDASFALQIRLYSDTRKEADRLRSTLAEALLSKCGTDIGDGHTIEESLISEFNDTFDSDDGSYGALFVWSASVT